MRWILAGIAFALLVTLAVVTVVIEAQNRRTQGRIERLSTSLMLVQVERARQAEWYFAQVSEPRLLERLAEFSRLNSRRSRESRELD
jgi:hypothetical protein